MSAITADKLKEPEKLGLPSDLQPVVDEVLENLTDDGRKAFLNDVLTGLVQSQEKGDLRYVQRAVVEWYRTLLFIRQRGFQERLLQELNEQPMTLEDVEAYLRERKQ